jgi:hypothetical protein
MLNAIAMYWFMRLAPTRVNRRAMRPSSHTKATDANATAT